MFNLILIFAAMFFYSPGGSAQTQAQGFALERFYPSAPGAGWFVMDTLDMHGGLGGAVSLTTGYAKDPLRVPGLSVVSTESFADVGLAATYDRYRLYLNLVSPISLKGDSGSVGDYIFTAPNVDWGTQPDTLSDIRIGFDARFIGDFNSPFRLGAGVQIFVPSGTTPNGNRADYDSDSTYRAMGRLLMAGDIGYFTYAGQVGAHIRQLDDSPTPGSPQGNEFLCGLAGGAKIPFETVQKQLIVGLELTEATAFRSFMAGNETALEYLLSTRLEGVKDNEPQFRLKFGVGGGINPQFGAPDWRALISVELFDHNLIPEKTASKQ